MLRNIIILVFLFLVSNLHAQGLLQNEDFKTEAQLITAGGSKSQLLNDTKIYVTADGINETLDDAISLGLLGFQSPLTTEGDLLSFISGTNTRVPIGSEGQLLTVVSGVPAWQDASQLEINALTEKVTPVDDDVLVIEDSADTFAKKKIKISSLPSGSGGSPGEADLIKSALGGGQCFTSNAFAPIVSTARESIDDPVIYYPSGSSGQPRLRISYWYATGTGTTVSYNNDMLFTAPLTATTTVTTTCTSRSNQAITQVLVGATRRLIKFIRCTPSLSQARTRVIFGTAPATHNGTATFNSDSTNLLEVNNASLFDYAYNSTTVYILNRVSGNQYTVFSWNGTTLTNIGVTAGLPTTGNTKMHFFNNKWYIAASDGVYELDNSTPVGTYTQVVASSGFSLFFIRNNRLYVSGTDNVLKSTSDGTNWVQATDALYGSGASGLTKDYIWLGTPITDGNLLSAYNFTTGKRVIENLRTQGVIASTSANANDDTNGVLIFKRTVVGTETNSLKCYAGTTL
jgi:hypothetical protein